MSEKKSTIDTIPLATAVERVTRWKEQMEQTSSIPHVKAVNVKKIDFQEILNEEGVESIRAYFGIDETGNVDLMFVGVNSDGRDMCGTEVKGNIYDITTPCPNLCDASSPLNIS